MFEAMGAMGMYKWIQAVSSRSCEIAHHLELREHCDGKAVTELKEELSKLREAHSKEIRLLEDKLKKGEDKWLAKDYNSLQD